MRKKTQAAVITLIVVSSLVSPILGVQSSSQNISCYGMISYSSGMRWLHADGKWIVDSEGSVVILRGANFMGLEWGAWERHSEQDYERMASWGFNVVRLPIAWHYIETQPGAYNVSYFENCVNKDIAWAKKHRIYIILDMHQWYWSPHFTYSEKGVGNGFPIWSCASYSNSEQGLYQAVTDFWNDLGPNGTTASSSNPSMQERFLNVWKYVASRYKNESTIAGFDLFNEPFSGNIDCTAFDNNILPLFYEKLIDAIRTVDESHILMWQPRWGEPYKLKRAPDRSNVTCSVHIYDPVPYQGNISDFRQQIDFITNFTHGNQPVLVSEYGRKLADPNPEEWTRDSLTVFDENKVSACWWAYWRTDDTNYGLLYPNGTVKELLLTYIDRSFPIRSSIEFTNMYFGLTFSDNSKQFRLITEASEGNFTVEVYMPARHYSDGFIISSNATLDYLFNDDTRILSLYLQLSGSISLSISPA